MGFGEEVRVRLRRNEKNRCDDWKNTNIYISYRYIRMYKLCICVYKVYTYVYVVYMYVCRYI